MFDKTRLPYVALDVFCVILGTSVPPGRGRVRASRGLVHGWVRACILWEGTHGERRTGVGEGCAPDARASLRARHWGGCRSPGTPLCSVHPGSRAAAAVCLLPTRALNSFCLDAVHASALSALLLSSISRSTPSRAEWAPPAVGKPGRWLIRFRSETGGLITGGSQ